MFPPHFTNRVTALEEDQNKVLSTKNEELAKVNVELGTNAQTLSAKETPLRDLGLHHALLVQTLYSVLQSPSVKEVAFCQSLTPIEDKKDEKAHQTRTDLINYIHVVEDD